MRDFKQLVYDINQLFDQIDHFLKKSSYRDTYYKYISVSSNTKVEISKLKQLDWNFCIFILSFIHRKHDVRLIYSLLEKFLFKYRFSNSLLNDPGYLSNTINNVIRYADDHRIRGQHSHLLSDMSLLVPQPLPSLKISKKDNK